MNTELAAIFPRITSPTLVVDEARAQANVAKVAASVAAAGVILRPHFKTPQSARASAWYRDAGVTKITVSSVEMATYFAAHGWDDIVIAFPVNLREQVRLNHLASTIRLGLLVDQSTRLDLLSAALRHPVDVWVEVDCGQGRTGVHWTEPLQAVAVAQAVGRHPGLRLQGLLSHAGHTYKARSKDQILAIHSEALQRIAPLMAALSAAGLRDMRLSFGDTPGCSVAKEFPGVSELRPGNFVFYDLMMVQIGACRESQIAAALACPVVGVYHDREEVAVHGGAVHLSKDFLEETIDGQPVQHFGRVAFPTADGWGPSLPGAYVRGLSQEHGMLKIPGLAHLPIAVGDLLIVLPVHSCLTADLMQGWYNLAGDYCPMMRDRAAYSPV
jgi:D-serine deaminase-like pyridoxal phosphate-dependent protein